MCPADIRQETTADALLAHAAAIAQDVRDSGGAGEAKAFDYIESCLQKWGIDYERTTHPAYISLPLSASLVVTDARGAELSLPCITVAMGLSTSPAGCSGVIYDVRTGGEPFPPGAIALIDGLATPHDTAWAAARGAAGIIFNNGAELHEMIVSNVWGSPSATTRQQLPQLPVVSITAQEAALIREQLVAGTCHARLITEVLTEWRQIPQLVAEIKAPQAEADFVLFAGHVDSWHYGAMDNAGANAVQLEALRMFQARRDQLKRNLRVAFWSGHSHGRYAGSQWYADNHWQELHDHAVLHLYVDSVGGRGATVLTEAWAMPEARQVAVAALQKVTGETFGGTRFGRGGDQSFYGIGISALYMCMSEQPADGRGDNPLTQLFGGTGKTAGLGWWWHNRADTIDKLDPAFLHRDASMYLLSLETVLGETVLPLDYSAALAEMEQHVRQWQEKAGDAFALADVLALVMDTQEAWAAWTADRDRLAVKRQNETLKQLSRHLVAVSYNPGERYEHGHAGFYPPIPAFAQVEQLITTAVGSAEHYELLVSLQRKKNFVKHQLHLARRLLQSGAGEHLI